MSFLRKKTTFDKPYFMIKREYTLTVKSKSFKEADEIVNRFKEFLNEKHIVNVDFQLITRVNL